MTRLQIPIPTGAVPSTAELKHWAISWLRSDKLWVKPQDGDDDDDDDRPLSLHCFKMRRGDDDDSEPARFVMANFIPGGKFVVVLYTNGDIELKEVQIEPGGEWELRDVAQYKRGDPEGFHTVYWSRLLTGTVLGRPLVAYVDREQEKCGSALSRDR